MHPPVNYYSYGKSTIYINDFPSLKPPFVWWHQRYIDIPRWLPVVFQAEAGKQLQVFFTIFIFHGGNMLPLLPPSPGSPGTPRVICPPDVALRSFRSARPSRNWALAPLSSAWARKWKKIMEKHHGNTILERLFYLQPYDLSIYIHNAIEIIELAFKTTKNWIGKFTSYWPMNVHP